MSDQMQADVSHAAFLVGQASQVLAQEIGSYHATWHSVLKPRLIGTARVQSDVPLDDYSEVEVYIGAEGDLWARRKVEFHDGRFHALAQKGGE